MCLISSTKYPRNSNNWRVAIRMDGSVLEPKIMALGKLCCWSFSQEVLLSLLLLTASFFKSSYEQIVDSLPPGSTLQGNQTLVSRNGTFSLGFFSLLTSSHRNYLGVSFHDIPISTQIWVANRNNPAGDGASLTFTMDGDLVLSNSDQTTVWKSGTGGLKVSSMVMEENGNLVLAHKSGRAIWESFEHPADTWVPGMRMYVGSNITSYKSPIDPAEGRFSMKMLPTTEFVSMWNATTIHWTSGVWIGKIFEDIPEMMRNYLSGFLYNFSLVNDSRHRTYFIFSEYNRKNLSHFTLESDGILHNLIWDSLNAKWHNIWTQPMDPCQVDHLCGQNGICNSDLTLFCSCLNGFKPVDPVGWSQGDWSLGCVADSSFDCRSGHFSLLQHTYYGQGESVRSYSGHNQDWCQASCKSDCACLGFSFESESGNCGLHHGPLFNGKTSADITQNFFLRLNSLDQSLINSSDRKRKSKTGWIIGLATAIGCASLLLLMVLLLSLRRKRHAHMNQSSKYISGILRKFSFKELRAVTNNYSEKLGAGGFGSVYKGSLGDRTMVAVKKLHNLKQGDKDFRAEVSTLGMIQHVNLVRLRGFCAEKENRLLVYDHMPNGSLNTVLFSKPGKHQKNIVLDWNTRYAIALGTARGITYLHEECRSCIIHCDIKPENILLDANFCAKVSDFGLAKLFGREFSSVITSMRGTRGYLAPEWLSRVPITSKADVYSYGMTLLEIISGRRNIDVNCSLEKWFFPFWAYKQCGMGNFSALADSKLNGNVNEEQLRVAVLCAIWCIQDEETERPSMARVVQMLEGIVEVPHDPPYPKSFLLLEVERSNAELESSI